MRELVRVVNCEGEVTYQAIGEGATVGEDETSHSEAHPGQHVLHEALQKMCLVQYLQQDQCCHYVFKSTCCDMFASRMQ